MTQICILLIIALLSKQSFAGSCNWNGNAYVVNYGGMPNLACSNSSLENIRQEFDKIIYTNTYLTLSNVNFVNLDSNYNFDNVEALRIFNNTLLIKKSAFENFRYLYQMEIDKSKVEDVEFEGFELGSNEYFVKLTMSENNISSLGAICMKHAMFKIFSLTENKIKMIKKESFSNCYYLEELDLSNNSISEIEPNAFRDINKLKSLNLKGNNFTKITTNSFTGLNNLYNLDLSKNQIEQIQPGSFNGLRNLKSLNLKNNNILKITTDSFVGLSSLENFDLSNSCISFLESGAFNGLINLRNLNLNNNNIIELVSRTFNQTSMLQDLDLSNNKLKRINPESLLSLSALNNLNLKNNNLVKITCNFFVGLNNLRNLDLSNLNITSLESGAFNGLYNLEKLNLNENRITELQSYTFNQTINLQILYLSNNPIVLVNPFAFRGLDKLDKLIWNPLNLIEIKSNSFSGLKSLKFLNLSHLNITNMKHRAFNGSYQFELDLTRNNLRKLVENTFNHTYQLRKLDLSFNAINSIEVGAFDGLDYLQFINLTRNKLTNFHCETTRYPTDNLRHMNLSYNEINIIDVCAFKNFHKLTELDLSQNNISSLLRGTFSPLDNLEKLTLSHNRLIQIDSPLVFPLIRLKSLDVSSNELVNWDVRPVISHIKTLNHVDLSENTWDCRFLTVILKALSDRRIDVKPRKTVILHEENVNGIRCADHTERYIVQDQDITKHTSGKISNQNISNIDEKFSSILKKLENNDSNHLVFNSLANFIGNLSNKFVEQVNWNKEQTNKIEEYLKFSNDERKSEMRIVNELQQKIFNIETSEIQRNDKYPITASISEKSDFTEDLQSIKVILILMFVCALFIYIVHFGGISIRSYLRNRRKNSMRRCSSGAAALEELNV